jgi:hypothetical protein
MKFSHCDHDRFVSETVEFGSGQGRSLFAAAGVVGLRRGLQEGENAGLGQKMLFLNQT